MDKNYEVIIRSEKQSISDNFTNRIIIAGFPGVGKSTAAESYPHLFIDMESSDYHWIYNEDGTKVCNPEWPMNYVNAIVELANEDPPLEISHKAYPAYICTSTHAEVLKEFENRNLYYIAVVPRSKDIYIKRYIDRGNNEDFIKLLNSKFYSFVKDVSNSSAFVIYYTDGYLADIFTQK